MATGYTQVDTELLAQMMKVAKQNPGTSKEHLEALQQAVAERKQQLSDQLEELAKQYCKDGEALRLNEGARLEIYQQLITLEPDNSRHYERAGYCARFIDNYPASVAYYSQALQLVGEDVDELWELYKERSRTYLYAKDYPSTLADGKMFLRYKYLSQHYNDSLTLQKSYNLYMICESLRQLGNQALGDQIEMTYKLAEYDEYGVTDELIEDYMHLLGIPFEPHTPRTRSPLTRFHQLLTHIPTDPKEVKRWQLGKQFYWGYDMNTRPDYALLIGIMRELVTLDPTNYRYVATIGGLYFKQQKYDEAIPHLTKALALGEQAQGHASSGDLFTLHRLLARIYFHRRPIWPALKHYELAIRTCPTTEEAVKLLALMIQCVISLDGDRASAMGVYFRREFPDAFDRKMIVLLEELWQESGPGVFVSFTSIGSEPGRENYELRKTIEFFEWEPEAVRAAKKQQEQAKAATMLNHLEQMLRLARGG